MNFELLPNEILLDLFDYMNGVDLLCAFYGLNLRFNFLLYKQFRAFHFNFNFASKPNFDMICQQHLPIIADRVISVSLSDYEDTPEQIKLFFSYPLPFSYFTQLQSLSLYFVDSYEMLLKLLDECYHLCNLTYLRLDSCYFQNCQADFQFILDTIWNLPKLIHLSFGIIIKNQQLFFALSNTSLTLEFVKISGIDLQLYGINRLYQCTPCLKRLSLFRKWFLYDSYLLTTLPTLISMNIFIYKTSKDAMINYLKNTYNLRHLNISLTSSLIDGHEWEEIICNFLPKLKVFRLRMNNSVPAFQNIQEQVDKLFDSFRSSFWIDDRRWFIRCLTWNTNVCLHTLPCKFNYCDEKYPDSWRSTHPHDNQQEICNNMTSISHETFFNHSIPSYINLLNIEYLWIQLPVNEQFWSIVPSLKRLNLLSIYIHDDTVQSQLQTLLDRAPHLHSLYIFQDESLSLQVSLFECINTSVRRLKLQKSNHYFNEKECIRLIYSPLGIQCETLCISVENRESIIILVQNMISLRALTIQCGDDENYKQSSLTKNDDKLVQWLRDHLPSICLITRNPELNSEIRIWI
jgi:hypothetical protein